MVDLDAEEVELSGLRLPRKLGCNRRGDLLIQARIDLELGAAAERGKARLLRFDVGPAHAGFVALLLQLETDGFGGAVAEGRVLRDR